jgi:hypothetical protein
MQITQIFVGLRGFLVLVLVVVLENYLEWRAGRSVTRQNWRSFVTQKGRFEDEHEDEDDLVAGVPRCVICG